MRILSRAPGELVAGNIRTVGPPNDVYVPPDAVVRLRPVDPHDGGIGPSDEFFEQYAGIDSAGAVPLAVPTPRSEIDRGRDESSERTCSAERPGRRESRSAASPEIWGAAKDVPEARRYPFPGIVVIVPAPGATRSSGTPVLLNAAMRSSGAVAPTAMVSSMAAG